MKKGMYKKSWQELYNNLYLLWPDVAYFFISALSLIFFGYLSGVFQYISATGGIGVDVILRLVDFFRDNMFKTITSLIGFFVFNFLIGVGKDGWKYTMIVGVIEGKKVRLRQIIRDKKGFYKRLVGLKIKVLLLYAVIAAVFGIILGLTGVRADGSYNWVILIFITGLLFFTLFTLGIVLIFRFAIMFLKDYDSSRTIKESFSLFRKHYKKFFFVFMVLFITKFVLTLMIALVANLPYLGLILEAGLSLLLLVWADLYIFYTYKG